LASAASNTVAQSVAIDVGRLFIFNNDGRLAHQRHLNLHTPFSYAWCRRNTANVGQFRNDKDVSSTRILRDLWAAGRGHTHAGDKMLDHGTDAGDLTLERQATWGMSVRIMPMSHRRFLVLPAIVVLLSVAQATAQVAIGCADILASTSLDRSVVDPTVIASGCVVPYGSGELEMLKLQQMLSTQQTAVQAERNLMDAITAEQGTVIGNMGD